MVRRKPDSSCLDEKYLRPAKKFPLSIMIWGCFSRKGLGLLWIVDQSITGDKYVEILEQALIPSINLLSEGNEVTFQQDNAPAHTAKKVKDFLQDKGISSVTWPSNSPDLNPIENLWSYMKNKIRIRNPSNKNELVQEIKKVWEEEIPLEYLHTLIDSMQSRLKECLENDGGLTHY